MNVLRSLIAGIALLTPVTRAFAQAATPPTPCTGLFGCPGTGTSTVTPGFPFVNNFPQIIEFMLEIAAGVAVFFVVYSGMSMILYSYDSSKVASYRFGVIFAIGGLLLAIMSQSIVRWAITQEYTDGTDVIIDVLATAVTIIRTVVSATFGIMVIVAGIRMVIDQGKGQEFDTAKSMLIWSVAGIIIVNLAATLVGILASYFVQ